MITIRSRDRASKSLRIRVMLQLVAFPLEVCVKPGELPKVFPGSATASAWITGLLTLYCGGAFVLSLARHLDWASIGLTGMGAVMFTVMTAWNILNLRAARRVQSEYSFTASRQSSKPARSP